MTPDLAAREKAAELAESYGEALAKQELACEPSVPDAEWEAADEAHDRAFKAMDEFPHKVLPGKDGKPFRCPNPKCRWPILEEDFEEIEE
jgi:hypothetical protein